MLKKPISILLKSRRGLAAVCLATVLIVGVSVSMLTSPTKTADVQSDQPQVKSVSTKRENKTDTPGSSTAANDTALAARSTTSTPTTPSSKTSTPTATSLPTSTQPANSSPPTTPAAAVDLTLGALTFDNYTNPAIITFDLPLSASASGPVTMTVVRQETGATLCSRTISVTANEDVDFQCSYTPTEAPHMVNATVSAGTSSVQSSNVYDGYFSG